MDTKYYSDTITPIIEFIDHTDYTLLSSESFPQAIKAIFEYKEFKNLVLALIHSPAFSKELGEVFERAGAIKGLSACRNLRGSLNLTYSRFFGLLSELIGSLNEDKGKDWYAFANKIHAEVIGQTKLLNGLLQTEEASFYRILAHKLENENPHALYPTSSYRESKGYVVSTKDNQHIEAVMSQSTFTSIRVMEDVLNPEISILRDSYIPFGRCVCLVDQNVDHYYGEKVKAYFHHHRIKLDKLVYRAMEVDKGIGTVERMLGDFKRLGVSRNEPVLIIGGGVLTDTGGLACALYHRNTPYIMLSTSIVAGIDAGPSPRTCCDGFGYKNLFGAYHAPVMAITDRSFFKTLHKGWLRHGVAEIIKMAVVKDLTLFEHLEKAGQRLIDTSFGTINCEPEDEIHELSQQVLGAAMRSYIEAEYDNLYETHQCRPHAYGHTWSPGFEIKAGLLHGHAVAIGMGLGAYLSYRAEWIHEHTLHRIMRLINSFELSLWHDILLDKDILWEAQLKIIQKRGSNLVAPVPKNQIGQCGYLNKLSKSALFDAIEEYHQLCLTYPAKGVGTEPLCSDVGLEDPSTVFNPHANGNGHSPYTMEGIKVGE